MRLAGDGVPRPKVKKPKPKPYVLQGPHDVGITAQPKPKAAPRPKVVKAPSGGPTPRQRGQSLTQAPAIKAPKRRGHAPTVFDQPLTDSPTDRLLRDQRRHLARGVLKAFHAEPARPLKASEVDAVLSHPQVKDLLKSTLPYLPKDSPHHGLLHNVVHGIGGAASDVTDALTTRGHAGPIQQSVVSQKQADVADKAIQKTLGSLNSVPSALTAMPNRHLPGSSFVPGAAEDVSKAVRKTLKKGQTSANRYRVSTSGLGPNGKLNPTVKKVLKNAAGDVVSLPANAISSTYLTVAHPGEVLKSTEQQLAHPVKSFEQHPVNTLLVARGIEGALSRGLGDAARSGVLGKGAKKYASTQRVPLKLVGNATVQRRYSKGLVEQGVQRAVDRRAVRKGRGTTVKVGVPTVSVVRTPKVSAPADLRAVEKAVARHNAKARRAGPQGPPNKPAWEWTDREQAGHYGMTFSSQGDAVPGGYNFRVYAKGMTGKPLGHIDVNTAGNEGVIADIKVDPAYQRQGVATRLLDWVRRSNPDLHLKHGMTTPEGEAWRKSLPGHMRGAVPAFSETGNYAPTAKGINAKTFYHGTKAEGLSAQKLDTAGTNHANLFGQGVYLTDSPEIAKGYSKTRGKTGTPRVYQAKVNVRKVLDLEAPVSRDFADILAERAKHLGGVGDEELVKQMRTLASKPGVTNDKLYSEFRQGVADFSHYEQVPSSQLVEDFQQLADELRAKGYDALTHIGGKRTGNEAHQVVVMLKPRGGVRSLRPHRASVHRPVVGKVPEQPLRQGSGRLVPKQGYVTRRVTEQATSPAIQATEKQMLKPGIGRPQSGHLNRRIDQEVGTNNGMLTIRRSKVHQLLHEARPSLVAAGRLKAKAPTLPTHVDDAVALVGEGILKQGDLKSTGRVQQVLEREREDIRRHAVGQDPADQKLSEDNVATIDRLLADKKFLANPQRVFASAENISGAQRVYDAARAKHGDFGTSETGGLAAARQRVVLPFAERELGLKFNEKTKRFETQSGDTVPTEQILKEFEKAGGNRNHLFYVPRYKELDKPSRFRGGAGGGLTRPGGSKRYTGSDTHTRAYHRSYAAITEHMAHSAARIERHHGMNELVNLFGLKTADGHYFADKAAGDAEIRNQAQLFKDTNGKEGGDYVQMLVARKSAPDSLMQELDPAEMARSFHKPGEGDGSHIVLMPRAVAERINKHENLRNTVVPEFQTALHYFRHAVLPTSPRWLAGNVLEALLRTAINDPTLVRSMKTGHKLGKELSALGPKGVRQLERLQAGAAAGHFGSQKYLDYFRPEDERNFMGKVHAFRQAPGPKQVGDAWDAYYKTVVGLNERLESSVYYGALGKEARAEVQAMTNDWHKTLLMGKAAYQDVAKGLLDSNNVARYVAAVDKMRGRYANLSPKGRWWTTTMTPFAPWMVNALHFIAVTMPAHHPVLTGLLAAENLGTEKRRKGENLPPWLEGAVKVGGKAIDVNRFTPAGVMAHGPGQTPVLSNLHDYVLPQASSFLLNLAGKDWTLKDLPPGANSNLVALNTAFETFIPFLSAARRIREGGGTSIPGSTVLSPKVKPGTRQSSALKVAGKVFLPGFPQNASTSGGVGNIKNVKPSKGQASGGNRFLQGGGGNRFLQGSSSGNRFLSGG